MQPRAYVHISPVVIFSIATLPLVRYSRCSLNKTSESNVETTAIRASALAFIRGPVLSDEMWGYPASRERLRLCLRVSIRETGVCRGYFRAEWQIRQYAHLQWGISASVGALPVTLKLHELKMRIETTPSGDTSTWKKKQQLPYIAPNACMRWYLTLLIFCKTAMEAHLQVMHTESHDVAQYVWTEEATDTFPSISGNSKELLLYIKNTEQKWGRVVANIILQIARNWLTQVSHGDSECSCCNGNKLDKIQNTHRHASWLDLREKRTPFWPHNTAHWKCSHSLIVFYRHLKDMVEVLC